MNSITVKKHKKCYQSLLKQGDAFFLTITRQFTVTLIRYIIFYKKN
jgi:hypothetical protein